MTTDSSTYGLDVVHAETFAKPRLYPWFSTPASRIPAAEPPSPLSSLPALPTLARPRKGLR